MANLTHEIRHDTRDASVLGIDMKLEVVVLPVSDVDRAKKFYGRLACWLEVRPPGVVQFIPPGEELPQ